MSTRPGLTKFKQDVLIAALDPDPDATILVVRGRLSTHVVEHIAGQFDRTAKSVATKYGWTAIELGA